MGDAIDRAQDIAMMHQEITRQQILQGMARKSSVIPVSTCSECIDCGEEINPARRQAMPEAMRCIQCQTDYERRGKQR